MSNDDTTSNVTSEQREIILKQIEETKQQDTDAVVVLDRPQPAVDSEEKVRQGHEEASRKLQRYLEHHGSVECPNCQNDRRFLHPALQFSDPTMKVLPPVQTMPTIMPVSCRRCGHIRFFAANAVLMTPTD